MKKVLLPLALMAFAQPALADDGAKAFGEIGLGAGFSHTDLKFYNPSGAAFTSNTTSGSYINLSNKDNRDTNVVGYVAAGLKVNQNVFVRASFQHFGTVKATGGAGFFGNTFNQDYKARANGVFIGLGGNFDLSSSVFAEASGDLGVGFVKARGRQGANLGATTVFPAEPRSNLAWGIGGGLGVRLSDNVALVGKVNYYDLGKANTARAGVQVGIHPDERLETDLSTVTTTLGLRFGF